MQPIGESTLSPSRDAAAHQQPDGRPGTRWLGLPRRRAHRVLLVLILLAVVALPVCAIVLHARSGSGLSDQLRLALAARVQVILEGSQTIRSVGQVAGAPAHEHEQDAPGPVRVLCAVDPFGIDPPDARTVAQVHWVYAQHLCTIAAAGTPWEYATKSAGPVAVELTDPARVVVPQPRQDYRTQVKAMIPARYQAQAFGTFAHPEVVTDLRKRFNAQSAA